MPVNFIIQLMFVCAFLAIVWWAITKMGVPEPIRTIILVLIALIVLFWLWNVFSNGGFHTGRLGSLTGPAAGSVFGDTHACVRYCTDVTP